MKIYKFDGRYGTLACALIPMLIGVGCRAPEVSDVSAGLDGLSIPTNYTSSPRDGSSGLEGAGLDGFPVEAMRPHINELLEKNYELAAAVTRVEAGLASAGIARSELFPNINASLGGSKTRQNFIGLPIPGQSGPLTTRFTSYNLSFNTQWEIDLWGRIRNARDAAELDAQSFARDREWIERSLTGAYLQSWTTATAARELSQLADQIAVNREAIVSVLEDRFSTGLVSADRLRSARNAFETAKTSSIQAMNDYRDALRQVEKLLGRYPGGTIEIPERSASLPDALQPGIPSDILELRPDIEASRLRLEASARRVRESFAGLFPRISLTGSTGTSSDQLSDLTDLDFSVWSLGGNIARPVIDFGRLRALLDLSEVREREAFQNYLNTVQNAFLEVENALDAEGTLRESIRLVEDSIRRSRAQYDSSLERFHLGVGDRQSVLEAEYLVLLESQRLLNFETQFLINRVDLIKSLGQGPFISEITPGNP